MTIILKNKYTLKDDLKLFLGEYKGKYPQQCQQKCDMRAGCNSFTFCTASPGSLGTCHLKGRVLIGKEATKPGHGCTSSYLA